MRRPVSSSSRTGERQDASLGQDAILASLRQQFAAIQEEDRADVGLAELQQVVQEIMEQGRSRLELAPMNTTFRAGVPQLYADIDRAQVKMLDLRLSDVFGTLQAALGSAY